MDAAEAPVFMGVCTAAEVQRYTGTVQYRAFPARHPLRGPSTWYQVLGTKYLVPSTLGSKYLVLIMIIFPFLISPFDRVQTTLFEDLFFFVRHRIG